VRGELEAYGAGLTDKPEIVALNKIDALTPEEIDARAAELEAACGSRPLRLSGASQKGVPEAVQTLYAIVSEDRAKRRAIEVEAAMTPEEKTEGWTP
jgi:GTPase